MKFAKQKLEKRAKELEYRLNENKKLSRKRLAELFNIPCPTINDWSKAEKGNWRYKIVEFLSNLSEEEIKAVKARSVNLT